ncbi:hypothetical protein L596_023178 [Steinernema carpocapsae]|uniref:Uncharacterized protein n=1 Tax=Steinernema carpocapsae TaxID=34508 RepID=A0A4U5MCW4_STECR|nr:hypothetical protein L596_023178 [Steinernema carpocapsae]
MPSFSATLGSFIQFFLRWAECLRQLIMIGILWHSLNECIKLFYSQPCCFTERGCCHKDACKGTDGFNTRLFCATIGYLFLTYSILYLIRPKRDGKRSDRHHCKTCRKHCRCRHEQREERW